MIKDLLRNFETHFQGFERFTNFLTLILWAKTKLCVRTVYQNPQKSSLMGGKWNRRVLMVLRTNHWIWMIHLDENWAWMIHVDVKSTSMIDLNVNLTRTFHQTINKNDNGHWMIRWLNDFVLMIFHCMWLKISKENLKHTFKDLKDSPIS